MILTLGLGIAMTQLPVGGYALAKIHAANNDKKYFCHLTGFLEGVIASGYLEKAEFAPLLVECREFFEKIGDPDAYDILEDFAADILDYETIKACAYSRAAEIDPTCDKSALNRFLGFCRGIACDGVIKVREAKSLVEILSNRQALLEVPGVLEIFNTASDAISDGIVEQEESEEIARAITAIVGDSYIDTGLSTAFGVAVFDEYRFSKFKDEVVGSIFVLTGSFKTSPRKRLELHLSNLGATVNNVVSGKTQFLIIGGEASRDWIEMNRGLKLRKALELRQKSASPHLVSEAQIMRHLKN